jgi:hypothetical protein
LTSFAEPLFRRQSFYERFIFDSFSPHPSSVQKRFSLPHNPLHNHQQIALFQAATKGTTQNQNRATKNTTPQIACFSAQPLSKSLQSLFLEKLE